MKPVANEETEAFLGQDREKQETQNVVERRSTFRSQWWPKIRICLEVIMAASIVFLLFFRAPPTTRIKRSPVPEFPKKIITFYNDPKYTREDMFLNESTTLHTLHNWIPLSSDSRGYVSLPDYAKWELENPKTIAINRHDDGPGYMMSVFHQLHCLSYLAEHYQQGYGGIELTTEVAHHSAHCFNYIRQGMMCNADVTLEGDTDAGPGEGSHHECVDYDALLKWANDHAAYKWRNSLLPEDSIFSRLELSRIGTGHGKISDFLMRFRQPRFGAYGRPLSSAQPDATTISLPHDARSITMRLLHINGQAWSDDSLNISICEFLGVDVPPYMILSHRWRNEEVLYADMATPHGRNKKGWAKIETSCRIALQLGINYAWVDTCCIDKNSSADLSEAINSMFDYYAQCQICFAYLDDAEAFDADTEIAWFSRGWTLQELIAPKEMYFYSRNWRPLGSKSSLCDQIASRTGISEDVLRNVEKIDQVSIAERMSWAAERSTTRPEDEAYCLLGIFGVNMPPLYGEGRQKAFRRLQLELMQINPDQTIFAWHSQTCSGDMLAPSVQCFRGSGRFESAIYAAQVHTALHANTSPALSKPDHNMTNFGLHIQFPYWWEMPPYHGSDVYIVAFSCRIKGTRWYVGAYLQRSQQIGFEKYHRIAIRDSTISLIPTSHNLMIPSIPNVPMWISEGGHSSVRQTSSVGNSDPFPRLSVSFSLILRERQMKLLCKEGIRDSVRDNTYDTLMEDDHGRVRHHSQLAITDYGFQHGYYQFFAGKFSMNVAIGLLDHKIWFRLQTGATEEWKDTAALDYNFAAFHFPTGAEWQQQIPDDIRFFDIGAHIFLYTDGMRSFKISITIKPRPEPPGSRSATFHIKELRGSKDPLRNQTSDFS